MTPMFPSFPISGPYANPQSTMKADRSHATLIPYKACALCGGPVGRVPIPCGISLTTGIEIICVNELCPNHVGEVFVDERTIPLWVRPFPPDIIVPSEVQPRIPPLPFPTNIDG